MSEPIQVDFSQKTNSGTAGAKTKQKEVLIPPDKAVLKVIIDVVITLVGGVILYYFMLPPMNFQSIDFYVFWLGCLAIFVIATLLTSGAFMKPEYMPYAKRNSIAPAAIAVVLVVVLGVGYLVGAKIFRASTYSKILAVNDNADFNTSVSKIDSVPDFANVPMVDQTASNRLADKVLGDLATIGLESQFDIASDYSTQINYKGAPCRVYPLKYGNVFKWLNNTRKGFPGYVIVNMNTQDTQFVFVDNDQNTDNYIKYAPTEHFQKNLKRIVRFKFPTTIIGNISFEADDNGTPFFICQDMKMRVGLIGGRDVQAIILVNAVTGEMSRFTVDELKTGKAADNTDLTWIDQVYDANLLVEQYNYYGMYNNGFFNSLFGQTGVKKTTAGASYLALNDDVYCYTGVTSVTADESILGFILINQRTKDAQFYSITGATEVSAMNSANGALSDKGWQATFPLLINLDGEATYFMAMKDSTDVVKSYAMVNVSNYNIVATDSADGNPDLKKCIQNYVASLKSKKNLTINVDVSKDIEHNSPVENSQNNTEVVEKVETKTVKGVVSSIKTQNENGSTCYYIQLSGDSTWYKIDAGQYPEAIFIGVGSNVSFDFTDDDVNPVWTDVTVTPVEEESTDAA